MNNLFVLIIIQIVLCNGLGVYIQCMDCIQFQYILLVIYDIVYVYVYVYNIVIDFVFVYFYNIYRLYLELLVILINMFFLFLI